MYRIVVPGDFISKDVKRAGEGTYIFSNCVYAQRYGVLDEKDEIKVVPFKGKYVPRRGDVVIGSIIDISFPFWIVEIASPYKALLHVLEVSDDERIEFGKMNEYLNLGDVIVAKVRNIDVSMRIELTLMKEFRIKRGDRIIEIPHTKIPRIIGRHGSMIKLLKERSGCFIFIAKNGRIWIKGDENAVNVVSEAILMIANEAHTSGLTDRVAAMLDALIKQRKRKILTTSSATAENEGEGGNE
ncbi:MAG: exosome complex RNA-binding protein Rrp4 [Canidatus Methanoxibalbensis ujae]|nr:exosome complex RNA-binding protein Rrp4 [Candidatus Methanoxibalbensis ujae]MCW7078290.1 exosome complex RNA-binding protein Rrp4 [Candidatus Methanoxibalbensis ujae]